MKREHPTREEKLRVVFAFLIVYGVVLFTLRPHPTGGQVSFRLGVMAVGVLGLAALHVRGRRARHK